MHNDKGINRKVLMKHKHSTQRKEVTAVDADVPLLRPTLIRTKSFELRSFKIEADRLAARHIPMLRVV